MKINLNKETLSKYKSWGEFFPDKKVSLKKLPYHHSWNKIMEKLFDDPRCLNLEKKLTAELEEDINVVIYPPPELVFNFALLTSFDKTSVVIIGQDPYFNSDQAMGLSFSVPHDVDVPSSLNNIYTNMLSFNRIKKKPNHGNLEFWAIQGCLMLNSSLTVKDGADNKNCHQNHWRWFTNSLIKYISDEKENVIFVLWGKDAYDKMPLIDLDKHDVTTSSHPSGLSCNKPMGNSPAFVKCDHFGKINEYLEKTNREPIVWQC